MAVALVPRPFLLTSPLHLFLHCLSFFLPVFSIYQRIIESSSSADVRGGSVDGSECPICLCSIGDGEGRAELRCGHLFHLSCMDVWVESRGSTCPLCRSYIFRGVIDDMKNMEDGDKESRRETIVLCPFAARVGDSDRDSWWLR